MRESRDFKNLLFDVEYKKPFQIFADKTHMTDICRILEHGKFGIGQVPSEISGLDVKQWAIEVVQAAPQGFTRDVIGYGQKRLIASDYKDQPIRVALWLAFERAIGVLRPALKYLSEFHIGQDQSVAFCPPSSAGFTVFVEVPALIIAPSGLAYTGMIYPPMLGETLVPDYPHLRMLDGALAAHSH